MEEDDHDELLQCTDDESLSDNEDQCLPADKPEENYRQILNYLTHSKPEFIATKIGLIVSTTSLLILLPLYLEAINVRGNAYSLILTNTAFASIIFIAVMIIIKFCCNNFKLFTFPIHFYKLIILTVCYFVCGFMVLYSLDRKRVLCHLQDPIKGIALVFALLYYFFFCKKLMGLQRIFSATTIIVGLFIAVDYGLCDEFRCRGFERQHIADDGGQWSWQTHSIWTAVYIFGLAMFAAYYTLMDRYVLSNNDLEFHTVNPPTFLNTISRAVSNSSNKNMPTGPILSNNQSQDLSRMRKYTMLHLATWIHVFGLVFIVTLFWTDFIPALGKGSNGTEFLNFTTNGIMCHFQISDPHNNTCGNVFLYSWFFLISYMMFMVMSLKFLLLSQSTVYTIATMTTALPLLGVWWALFHFQPQTPILLVWAPSLTGELICSLLGLPIVGIGLYLFCKAHFKDYQWSRMASTHVMTSNHFA